MSTDPFTMSVRLCDDAGTVSNERVDPPNLLDAELTYLKQFLNLQSRTPNATRYTGGHFGCTGSAHLAGEHIRCTSPAHMAQRARDIVDLIHGAPGPYLETETSFFGAKRVDASMKTAKMETDCGGAVITKGKLTYGEADALAAAVDLSDYPAFVAALTPNAYWRSPHEKPRPPGVYFVGEVWWSIYSFLTVKGHICSMTPASHGKGHPRERGPGSYDNGMEYLYDEVLKRLVAAGVYIRDAEWRWFKRGGLSG